MTLVLGFGFRFWVKDDVSSKAKLAEYIAYRKYVLELLEEKTGKGPEGKFELEKTIHNIVFPLRKTSDDLGYEDHNLWVIDEKLSYHHYVASGIQLKDMPLVNSGSRKEPDLVIFERPIAIAEGDSPYTGVVLVEFKRPMRKGFGEPENPIAQVYGYINEIRKGVAKRANSRPIKTVSDPPYFCYILCDLTPKMHDFAAGANLFKTSDGQGYYGWNQAYNAYVEIIDYDKLLSDAKRRNRILFDKLGIG